jgi:hypothetical protein
LFPAILKDSICFSHSSVRKHASAAQPFQQQLLPCWDFSGSITQQQAESVRPRKELMTAAAHPTPVLTKMASAGQFFAHAPHSMQASLAMMLACFLFMANTAWGHTIMHTPHLTHLFSSNLKDTTFLR